MSTYPIYRTVVFHDTTVDQYLKIGSTISVEKTIAIDGEPFPYVTVEVSSASPPTIRGNKKSM